MHKGKSSGSKQAVVLWLGCGLLAIAVALPDAVQAQGCQHGAAIFKSCQSPKRSCGSDIDCDDLNECTTNSCDTGTLDNHTDCTITLIHADTCGDVTKITEAWDVQDTAGDAVRVPAVGDLPIVGTNGNTICCPVLALPCFVGAALDGSTIPGAETGCGDLTLPGIAVAGSVSFQQNTYLIQPNDPDPLEDQANVRVKDLCTAGIPGCSQVLSLVQFTASTDLETGCINDPEAASTPCTDVDGNICTQAGCDGAGQCDQGHISTPVSTSCPDTDGDDCSTAGCDGAGRCDQLHIKAPDSTPCPDTDDDLCTTAGCNGAGACDQRHIEKPCVGECLTGGCDADTGLCVPQQSSVPCTDSDGNDCTQAGCDGAGQCDQGHIFAPASEPCPDTDGNECTTAGCDGAGTCDQNHIFVQNSTPCPDTDGNGCSTAGCDGVGNCDQQHSCQPGGTDCEAGGLCDDNCGCLVVPPPDDHYKCYKTRQKGAKFAKRQVELEDQFTQTNTTVVKPHTFCNPVDKNGEGISDPTAHLMCYKIKESRFQKQEVVVENQFGTQNLLVTRPYNLCAPAEKDHIESALNINHFKCYRVRQSRPRFTQREVGLADQFEDKITTVRRPRLLCNPVEKRILLPITVSPIVNPDNHLVCYSIRDAKGQPRFQPVLVDVEDQFAEHDLNTLRGDCRKGSLLCLPSSKRIASPSGAFLDVETGLLD